MSRTNKSGKVYFYGTTNGKAIKIGFTNGSLDGRRKQIESSQIGNIRLCLLAAVRGSGTHENELQRHFASINLGDASNKSDMFRAEPELVEYINWLRQQWWIILDEDENVDTTPEWPMWMPNDERRVGFMEDDGSELFSRVLTYSGPLANTPWNRLSTPAQKIGDDFYTPPDIVNAAREAMGGIDLDPASHWLANRTHKIPTYYHLQRSAFENKWFGKVWLNPPYPGKGAGTYKDWFDPIQKYHASGDIEQLCMISPVWAFTTQIAKPIMDLSGALILLSPTPEFWGHPKGRTGTNHPHAIIYIGKRIIEFREAFQRFGIPVKLLNESTPWADMWDKPFDKPELVWGKDMEN